MSVIIHDQAGFDFDGARAPLHAEFQQAIERTKAINNDALMALREVSTAFLLSLAEPSDAVIAEDLYRRADAALVCVRTRRQ